jgi:hypothetical protein
VELWQATLLLIITIMVASLMLITSCHRLLEVRVTYLITQSCLESSTKEIGTETPLLEPFNLTIKVMKWCPKNKQGPTHLWDLTLRPLTLTKHIPISRAFWIRHSHSLWQITLMTILTNPRSATTHLDLIPLTKHSPSILTMILRTHCPNKDKTSLFPTVLLRSLYP